MFKNIKRITNVLFILFFVNFTIFATEHKTVNVAWINIPGFFEKNSDGSLSGFGYEFLYRIAHYSNWDLHFVESWNGQPLTISSADELVASGSIDIIAPLKGSETHVAAYSSYAMAETTINLFVLKSDDRYQYGDSSTIHDMRIGYLTSSKNKFDVITDYVKNNDLKGINYIEYESESKMLFDIRNLKLDGYISERLSHDDDFAILLSLKDSDAYIGVTPSNTALLSELNTAMATIQRGGDDFAVLTYEKYFNKYKTYAFSFTKEELEYINQHPDLTVAICTDIPAFGAVDKHGYIYGSEVDLMERISSISGLKFNYMTDIDYFKTKAHFDIMAMSISDLEWNRSKNITRVLPYLDMTISAVTNKDVLNYEDKKLIVAVLDEYFVSDAFPHRLGYTHFVSCKSIEDCIACVNDGNADVTFISNYMISSSLGSGIYKNIYFSDVPNQPLYYGVAIKDDMPLVLVSILNKSIHRISPQELNAMINTRVSQYVHPMSFSWFITQNPVITSFIIGLFLFLVIVVIALLTFIKMKNVHERNILKVNEELQKLNETKSNFLARMSHDIRTPLNGIVGITELALSSGNVDNRNDLKKIKKASLFLSSLVNDFLDMTKLEQKKMELHVRPYSFEEFFNYIDIVMEPLLQGRNLTVSKKLVILKGISVYIDPLKINQILYNILSNAVKFTPDGGKISFFGENFEITPATIEGDFCVKDSGVGMSEEFKEKLFSPFSREHNELTATTPGTGLGLSITKELVELMGGTITAESELGKGTTFRIHLKLKRAESSVPVAVASVPTVPEILNGKRVLLCEDNDLNREIATRLLMKVGIIVECAENGKAGVNLFQKSSLYYYDAILMDIRMPVMDGLIASKMIRSLDREDSKTIPIIAMTANTFKEDVEDSKNAGMNSHLCKPIIVDDLYGTLAMHIADYLSEQQKK